MAKKYYTMAVCNDGIWEAEFGDYDKDVVYDEQDEFKHHPMNRGVKTKIIISDDDQASINAAIARLNGEIK